VRIALGGVFNSGILATGVREREGPLRFNYGAAPARGSRRRGRSRRRASASTSAARGGAAIPARASGRRHRAVRRATRRARDDAVRMIAHPIPDAFWRHLRDAGLIPTDAPLPR
jgi:D-threo-aldose 1-dehydrogenase